MSAPKPHRFAIYLRTAAMCALIATTVASQQAEAQVAQLAPATSVKKVVNGKFAAEVDSGWVIYQGVQGQPTLNFFDTDTNGAFKLKTNGFGSGGAGLLFNAGGIVFAPCPVAPAPVRCELNSDTGQSGVGVGFGQATFGGPGGAAGGWVNDSSFGAHLTNPDQNTGSIAALAADSVNGAFAVGWDLNTTTFKNHAVILKLDSAGQTYAPVSRTDLGTLGGPTSSALAISKNAKYIAGMADSAPTNRSHAVFALATATSWTDIASGFPAEVIKSRAFAVSNTGFVAGTAAVKRLVGGKKKTIDIGFVFNTANSTVKFFEAPGYNVAPLKVLDDGRVVGNLVQSGSGAIKAEHPFLFDGSNVVDFGTMTVGGQPSFGCRVNRPNNLGELAGSCIPDGTTPYGIGGSAFYINAAGPSPAFIDVNAAIHANSDANTPGLAPYHIGSVTSIDDADEITVMGVKIVSGTPNLAAFLVAKPAYNP